MRRVGGGAGSVLRKKAGATGGRDATPVAPGVRLGGVCAGFTAHNDHGQRRHSGEQSIG